MKYLVLVLSLICVCSIFGASADGVPDPPALPDLPLQLEAPPFDVAPLTLAADAAALDAAEPPDLSGMAPQVTPYPWQTLATPTLAEAYALIQTASRKHGVPAAFIKSIMAAESNFDHTAVSPRGAIGLMQLMPDTAHQFGADPTIPAQNVDAGTHYLRVLIDRYKRYKNSLTRVIAAYNAGPATVDRYRGVPPYPETKTYVARVLEFLKHFRHERA